MLYIYHNPWLILQLEPLPLNPLYLSQPPHSLPLCQPAFFSHTYKSVFILFAHFVFLDIPWYDFSYVVFIETGFVA